MKFFRIAAVVAGAVLCVPGGAYATKFAGEFMAVGGGARALGLGGAFVAVAADVSTVYWNPAGLSGLDHREALAMHSERFGNLVNYNFVSYGQPTSLLGVEREAAWGAALLHLGVDGQVVTNQLSHTDLDGNGQFNPEIGEQLIDANGNPFRAYDLLPRETDNNFAFLGSFAFKTAVGRVGGNIKLIYSNAIAGQSSTGIGIDLGFLRRDLIVNHLDVGAKLQDATGTYISWSTGTNEFITPMLKAGMAYTLPSQKLNGAVLFAADADLFFDDRRQASQFWVHGMSSDLHLGVELQFQKRVMVRGGLDAQNPTAGAGLRFGHLGFDYAWLGHDDFDATHRVSVLASF